MTDVSPPKVSIVIPVYNGSDYLSEAIDSALAQTYPNIEILVVNDGSNDDGATERIARSYGDKVRYVSKDNGGVASALNLAIREMTGDYFSWLSHDDLYLPQKVERQMELVRARADGRTVVYSNYATFSGSGGASVPVSLKHIEPEQFRYWITVENVLHGCTLLIPKEAFSECGTFQETLRTTQDYDLWFRIATKYSFVLLPEVLVKARSHPEQGSIKMADVVLDECNALLSGFVDNLAPKELIDGSGDAPAVAYAAIARNLWNRGFNRAAQRAARRSLGGAVKASSSDRMVAISTLLKAGTADRAWDAGTYVANRFLPARARATLRRVLNAARRRLGGSPIDAVNKLALKDKFSEVYAKNIFGGLDSRSGAGSDLVQTEIIRHEIPRVLREYGVHAMLDAPCGDWFWMRQVDLGIERYVGTDIVPALIERNKAQFGREGVDFVCLDLSKDELPKVDLIFSRDCLVHLSFADASRILKNFKASGAKYLLTTTFTDRSSNADLGSGFWRPLNMELAPFNFPPPAKLINEGCTEGDNLFTDKSLGLWRLEDIPAFQRGLFK